MLLQATLALSIVVSSLKSVCCDCQSLSHCHSCCCCLVTRITSPAPHHNYTPTLHTLHTFNGPCMGTTQVSRYQKGKTNLDFNEARDSEWQWHQLDLCCTSLQTDNQASTPPLSFLQAGCPSCRPTNSVKVPKARNSLPST